MPTNLTSSPRQHTSNRRTLTSTLTTQPRSRWRHLASISCAALLCCVACSPISTTVTSPSTAATSPASASAASALGDPYEKLPKVPSLSVSSQTLTDGAALPRAQMSGIFGVPNGQDQSPHLQWSSGPKGTKSYVVTMYDIDAPTGSGFWHWAGHGLPRHEHERAPRGRLVDVLRHCFAAPFVGVRVMDACATTATGCPDGCARTAAKPRREGGPWRRARE